MVRTAVHREDYKSYSLVPLRQYLPDANIQFAVDGLFIGTGDLRLCMGLATGSLDGDEPAFVSALARIRDAAKANNLPMMGFGISHSTLKSRIAMGWNAFIIHGDIDAITKSAIEALDSYGGVACSTLSQGHKNGRKREWNGD